MNVLQLDGVTFTPPEGRQSVVAPGADKVGETRRSIGDVFNSMSVGGQRQENGVKGQ